MSKDKRGDVWVKKNQPQFFVICQGVVNGKPRYTFEEHKTLISDLDNAWEMLEDEDKGKYLGNIDE